ncbi:glucosyltransferase domain-containing protein [Butyrivibrio sp. LC3010]|uniref:glucosyltransferase domain-containing protein n=1 Tax=Butyrivibrio sp. LC3010 TaxID=1280680 RepID=UPI000416CEF3|nr:glucosyltransferase domain-containing protein [Butyrivibrio sp. LC3010]
MKLMREIERQYGDFSEKMQEFNLFHVMGYVVFWTFLSHGMIIFNKYSFHDDIGYYQFNVGGTYTLGRWALGFCGELEKRIFGGGHNFSLPVINVFWSVFFIGLSCVIIFIIFNFKSKIEEFLITGIAISIPMITGLFGYMFTASYYMLGAFLTCLGCCFWIIKGKRIYKICAIVLMSFSIGIYQANLAFEIAFLITYALFTTINKDLSVKEYLNLLFKVISGVLFSLVLYFVINSLVLKVKGLSMSSYAGLNTVGSISILTYLRRILIAYKSFFVVEIDKTYCMFPFNLHKLYYVSVVIGIGLMLLIILDKYKKNKIWALEIFILMIMFPAAVNSIFIMVPIESIHQLTMYSYIFLFVLFVCELNYIRTNIHMIYVKCISGCAFFILMLFGLTYARYSNVCYSRICFSMEEANSYFNTLVTRIQSVEGYNETIPIVYLNEYSKKSISFYDNSEFSNVITDPYIDSNGLINNYLWKDYMKKWIGFAQEYVPESQIDKNEYRDIRSMSHYPNDGSIKMIDGYLFVKF